MATSPREWLDHAHQIRKDRLDETGWRCAASRAYYAALHAARTLLPSVPDLPKGSKEGTHDRVIRQCTEYIGGNGAGADIVQVLKHQLKTMKIERTKCDYFLDYQFTEQDSDRMLTRAEGVLDMCLRIAEEQGDVAAALVNVATVAAGAVTPEESIPERPSEPPPDRPKLRRV